ncbi:hypothetical protein [Sphingomonas immobilis]|uniref:Uncharacterized protein n=1 Tax=Sphingomonas immobilis TaxID=3063997 RepID=A0ABT8ZY15_9SPHN|nr:hypothetical protein [Sphingomonas sp. CA1-15]MDO7842456.1 hypothetical protein [Sphingomonas sp. CA1-15]
MRAALIAMAAAAQVVPTLAELKHRGLVELFRHRALGPGERRGTALRELIVVGPRGTEKSFLPKQQFECLVRTGIAEGKLECRPRLAPGNYVHV